MRILVFSDSHGQVDNVKSALYDHPESDAVIFLGDGVRDFEALDKLFPQKFYILSGNCDVFCDNPTVLLEDFASKRIFAAHGHLFHVKYSQEKMINKARELKADIMLYGHTHQARCEYSDGLYIINPGSASGYKASYCILDITNQGIMANIVRF